MEIAIRHFRSGGVRMASHKLCADKNPAEQAFTHMRTQPGVISVRANYAGASIVVTYDPTMEPTLRCIASIRKPRSAPMKCSHMRPKRRAAKASPSQEAI
jgi:hypothetical protein